VLGSDSFSCEPASSDASFRRYFRVLVGAKSYVVMDAPPDKEDSSSFVAIAQLLINEKVNVPEIFHLSIEQGFMVLSDFGSTSYLDVLSNKTAGKYYNDAVQTLHQMHQITSEELAIPNYDADLLHKEMDLFEEWFLGQLLGLQLSPEDKSVLVQLKNVLTQSAIEQPQVFVHRDYHSRNLMLTEANNPGVIDFQDAVLGPITYDLVSLYRDCYIDWSDEKIYRWLDEFLQQRKERGCVDTFDTSQFYQWFDWMGIQRHMKAIGIFSRLLLRDGKSGYLNDIPRTLGYVVSVCGRYDELKPMVKILASHQVEKKLKQQLLGREDS